MNKCMENDICKQGKAIAFVVKRTLVLWAPSSHKQTSKLNS